MLEPALIWCMGQFSLAPKFRTFTSYTELTCALFLAVVLLAHLHAFAAL